MESTEESFVLDKRSENSDTIKLSEYMENDDEKTALPTKLALFVY